MSRTEPSAFNKMNQSLTVVQNFEVEIKWPERKAKISGL